MSRPSEPLLAWLRDLLKTKGLNTAHIAELAKLERSRVRKILAGAEPMTVDELMALSDALGLDPKDLTGTDLSHDASPPSTPALATAEEPVHTGPEVDPFGNQPEQIFRVAFGLGCTFLFVTDTSQLEESGVPGAVLRSYKDNKLPIRLEAAYHVYNKPEYGEEGVQLTLSFDALYDCFFPWSSIEQIVLFPEPPELTSTPPDEPEAESVPHLRLVT